VACLRPGRSRYGRIYSGDSLNRKECHIYRMVVRRWRSANEAVSERSSYFISWQFAARGSVRSGEASPVGASRERQPGRLRTAAAVRCGPPQPVIVIRRGG
jgi:hypothetical protein